MDMGHDVSIRQKFTKVIDSEEEAREFGEESAQIAWAYIKGFGQVELELESDN